MYTYGHLFYNFDLFYFILFCLEGNTVLQLWVDESNSSIFSFDSQIIKTHCYPDNKIEQIKANGDEISLSIVS